MFCIRGRNDFEMLVVYLTFSQMALMALTIIPTEMKLNKIFDKRGIRK